MANESWFRNKITWFSFLFSILVVWVHSANGELFLGQSPYLGRVVGFQRFLGNTVGQIAVPGFFLMSGYLFYRNFIWERLGEKWTSRIRSLLVPFRVWNTIYYLGYVIGSRLPGVSDIMGKGEIPFGWYAAVDAVLHYTYNYVFWYLYQLILLTVLAPALFGILQRRSLSLGGLAVLLYFVQKGTVIPYLNLDALFYYGVGAWGGLYGREWIEGQWSVKRALAGIGMWLLAVALFVSPWPAGIADRVYYRVLTPVGLWFFTDEGSLPWARPWMQYNFFLYAIHFALVRLVNKTLARILGGYWPVPVLLFLMMPALMVWFSSKAGSWMRRRVPVVWGLLNGGR